MPDDPTPIDRLRQIMAALRNPQTGCAWDLEQTFQSIAPYTIEEAYEVADAIERGDLGDLCDELGDLLLQVVFHAQMAEEAGAFGFDDVARAIADKLVRRHPHIFANGPARTPAEIERIWEDIKAEERARKAALPSVIDDVPVALPSLTRAQKLQKRLAKVGFDWPEPRDVAAKVDEEVAEFTAAVRAGDRAAMAAEFGDVLFSRVNVARHAGIDADAALRETNATFAARVRAMEAAGRADGLGLGEMDADEMERRWTAAKATAG